ncbi:unnamed protein product [Symbiodinium sp. KB8]|nr:unnamed protein product [Symbiodinium sp. KB8]
MALSGRPGSLAGEALGPDAADHRPPGWPGFLQGSEELGSRGGLLDDARLARSVGREVAEIKAMENPSQFAFSPAGTTLAPVGIGCPQTPVMAFVDRASFPGFLHEDEFLCGPKPPQAPAVGAHPGGAVPLTPRHVEWLEAGDEVATSSRLGSPQKGLEADTMLPIAARFREEDWEAELLAWKRKYGCPDVAASEGAGAAAEDPEIRPPPPAPAAEDPTVAEARCDPAPPPPISPHSEQLAEPVTALAPG